MTLADPSRNTPSAALAATPPRVVLDTNACLDLFVFAEPAVAALLAALQRSEVVAITNTACRDEWLRVLHYPMLKLDEAAIAAAIAAHDALVVRLDEAGPTPPEATPSIHLPRCADPDDQKFLQLALACGARWLLSRDKALLVLTRRVQRDGLFQILTPAAWHADA